MHIIFILNTNKSKQNLCCSLLKNKSGFTITELAVVAVIIAILTMLAFSILPDNIREARRAEGEAGILSLTAAMQRYYLDNNTYNDTDETPSISTSGAVTATHPLVSRYHADINSSYFDYSVITPDSTSFIMQATSKNFSTSANNNLHIIMKYTRGATPAEDWGVTGNTY